MLILGSSTIERGKTHLLTSQGCTGTIEWLINGVVAGYGPQLTINPQRIGDIITFRCITNAAIITSTNQVSVIASTEPEVAGCAPCDGDVRYLIIDGLIRVKGVIKDCVVEANGIVDVNGEIVSSVCVPEGSTSFCLPPETLSAQIQTGDTANLTALCTTGNPTWYETESSLTPIFTGNQFTTPPLTTSRFYYVSCNALDCVSARKRVSVIVDSNNTTCNPPVLTLTGSSVICSGETRVISHTANQGAIIYFKDGQQIASNVSQITVTTTGVYTALFNCNGIPSALSNSIIITGSANCGQVLQDVFDFYYTPENGIFPTSSDVNSVIELSPNSLLGKDNLAPTSACNACGIPDGYVGYFDASNTLRYAQIQSGVIVATGIPSAKPSTSNSVILTPQPDYSSSNTDLRYGYPAYNGSAYVWTPSAVKLSTNGLSLIYTGQQQWDSTWSWYVNDKQQAGPFTVWNATSQFRGTVVQILLEKRNAAGDLYPTNTYQFSIYIQE